MSKQTVSNDNSVMAFATAHLDEAGQGIVLVARSAGKTQVNVVTFFVDVHCLGIRRVTQATLPVAALLNKLLPALHVEYATEPVAVEIARGIVEGAATYAKKLGFTAAGTLAESMEIFDGITAKTPPFAFGKEGMPFYTQQPGDDEDFVEETLAQLRKKCGEKGFGYELNDLGEDWLDGEDKDEAMDEE
ncbi:MAG: hypothetical protein LBV12_07730 [Puniceicoccales bacterium]|jgi:hypothetical protein|nr:hypothetical protein [Puniceicoccales bacterium]